MIWKFIQWLSIIPLLTTKRRIPLISISGILRFVDISGIVPFVDISGILRFVVSSGIIDNHCINFHIIIIKIYSSGL
jgi:hypothetical protein